MDGVYRNYKFKDDNSAEQHNTLIMLDAMFAEMKIGYKPEFILCGGTALLFQGIITVATIDIDTATKLSDSVSELVTPFISDAAAEVILLPTGYKDRLFRYEKDLFDNMEIYCLSLEDLVITKLYAWRHKDKEDLVKTSLLERVDKSKVKTIIEEEVDTIYYSKLTARLERACDEHSLYEG